MECEVLFAIVNTNHFFFFFQAEDGIRDYKVTGVQTCALPILEMVVVTGVEMFRKLLDEGQAGDNVGLLLRGVEKHEVERGMVLAKPKSITPQDRKSVV